MEPDAVLVGDAAGVVATRVAVDVGGVAPGETVAGDGFGFHLGDVETLGG